MIKYLHIFLTNVLLAIVLSLNISAQPITPKGKLPIDPEIKTGHLANGLTYFIKQHKRPENRLELRLVVNVGSIFETEEQQGMAHFVEHMAFNGTKNFQKHELAEMFEKMGIKFGDNLNALTSFEETYYVLQIPTDQEDLIDKSLQVLEDWAHNITFDTAMIEPERNIIMEEMRVHSGEYGFMTRYMATLYKGSWYLHRFPLGRQECIKTFNKKNLTQFYRTWYRPDLMAVIAIGDINPSQIEEKIKQHFSKLTKPVTLAQMPVNKITDNKEPLIRIATYPDLRENSVEVYYKHPRIYVNTWEALRNNMMETLFIMIMNNRFIEKILEPGNPYRMALCNYGNILGRVKDAYILTATVKDTLVEKALECILLENEKVLRFGFTQTEFERAKTDYLKYLENNIGSETSSEIATKCMKHFTNNLELPGVNAVYDYAKKSLPDIKMEDINHLAGYFVPEDNDNMVIIVKIKNKEGGKKLNETDILKIVREVKSQEIKPYNDSTVNTPLLSDIPNGSRIINQVENKKIGYTEVTFQNGAVAILKPTDFQKNEILFSSISPGGSSLYPDKDVPAVKTTASLVNLSGIGNFDIVSLGKKISGHTLSVTPYIKNLFEGTYGHCAPNDLEMLLQLNYLYFTHIRRDEQAFKTFKDFQKNNAKTWKSDPSFVLNEQMLKTITKNDIRQKSFFTDKEVDSLKLDRMLEIFKQRFANASDFKFFFIGNFNIDTILPLLETYIGGLPSQGQKETFKENVLHEPAKGIHEVTMSLNPLNKATVKIMKKVAIQWIPEILLRLSMLTNILELRLQEVLREQQTNTYSVKTSQEFDRFPSPLFMLTIDWTCSPENVEKTVQTVLDEIEKIKENGPSESELSKVKQAKISDREINLKSNNFWQNILVSYYLDGIELYTYEEYKNMVNAITIEDIRDIARTYIDKENFVKGVVMPFNR